MKIVPLTLARANEFVARHHRHNDPTNGHKFSIGLDVDGELIGVGIAGRPVARHLDDGNTLELRRVCVKNGQKNACSKLIARLRQIGMLMGYEKIITYTLQSESGASLRAVRARRVADVGPSNWKRRNQHARHQPVYDEKKYRWELHNSRGAA